MNIFDDLTFDKFRKLALDNSISKFNKVGFPDSYREGKEKYIFQDIIQKVKNLDSRNQKVLDIGPGCSELPVFIIDYLEKKNSKLTLIDSVEMLNQLPDKDHLEKIPGMFPNDFRDFCQNMRGKFNAIISYSVIQYVFSESNLWSFLDDCLLMLDVQGELLLGDIPNISMRNRFFESEEGIKLHRKYTGDPEALPKVFHNKVQKNFIDDSVCLSIISRARSNGFHAWLIPQNEKLTFSNRREDILIKRP